MTDEPFLANMLVTSFPAKVQQQFGAQLADHPLRGEIIATRVANMLVNDMGLKLRQPDEGRDRCLGGGSGLLLCHGPRSVWHEPAVARYRRVRQTWWMPRLSSS